MVVRHDAAMNKDAPHGKTLPIHRRFDLAGTLILVVGLVIAVVIYVTVADDGSTAVSQELPHTRQYEYQLERFGGKAAVLAAEFNQWFESLWHGKQLASTVALLSIAVALGCYLIAHFLSDDISIEDKEDHRN
jgi:ABC-type cobalt transport system substrate-binding protein